MSVSEGVRRMYSCFTVGTGSAGCGDIERWWFALGSFGGQAELPQMCVGGKGALADGPPHIAKEVTSRRGLWGWVVTHELSTLGDKRVSPQHGRRRDDGEHQQTVVRWQRSWLGRRPLGMGVERAAELSSSRVPSHRVAAAVQRARRSWDRPAKPGVRLHLRGLQATPACVGWCSNSGVSLSAAILVGFFELFQKDSLTVGKRSISRAKLGRDDVLL
ncbi:hypothetical protein CYMTET_23444 [Cymbomonas tetramitiformis]|uniref:Uncharacterized protein n=1 Tax=Cymbomonas tetramitiformis TaxID=36881 RepID=A0AAE0FY70_9CHLO|nr:hypothetical protein CYMTET_23444 [Cymbomonas tetramitiformis]